MGGIDLQGREDVPEVDSVFPGPFSGSRLQRRRKEGTSARLWKTAPKQRRTPPAVSKMPPRRAKKTRRKKPPRRTRTQARRTRKMAPTPSLGVESRQPLAVHYLSM